MAFSLSSMGFPDCYGAGQGVWQPQPGYSSYYSGGYYGGGTGGSYVASRGGLFRGGLFRMGLFGGGYPQGGSNMAYRLMPFGRRYRVSAGQMVSYYPTSPGYAMPMTSYPVVRRIDNADELRNSNAHELRNSRHSDIRDARNNDLLVRLRQTGGRHARYCHAWPASPSNQRPRTFEQRSARQHEPGDEQLASGCWKGGQSNYSECTLHPDRSSHCACAESVTSAIPTGAQPSEP